MGRPALTLPEVLDRFQEAHGELYGYSHVEYTRQDKKVTIECATHGLFNQLPLSHWAGNGCPKCREFGKLTHSKVLEQFIRKHGSTYDYTYVKYNGDQTKVNIQCPKHGTFWQTPSNHKRGVGCPRCKRPSKHEDFIRRLLNKHGLKFEEQKRFKNCFYKYTLPFDFFVVNKFALEFDGPHHYDPTHIWFCKDVLLRDRIKTEFCHSNGITLFRSRSDQESQKIVKRILEALK